MQASRTTCWVTAKLLALLLICSAQGATFTSICPPTAADPGKIECDVQLRGEIVPGDSERLRSVLKTRLPGIGVYKYLNLESPGGSVVEALAVADVVREALLKTANRLGPQNGSTTVWGVSKRANCVSACFLIWAAGVERFLSGDGTSGIGLHRPYFIKDAYTNTPAKIAAQQQELMAKVRDYLQREQVPDRFIDVMMERSSRDVLWLNSITDGDAFINYKAWYEEMLIARCNYDPVLEAKLNQAAFEEIEAARQSGWRWKLNNWHTGPRQRQSVEYSVVQGECEMVVRRQAQDLLRKN